MTTSKAMTAVAVAMTGLLASWQAPAQEFPTQVVKLVVPYPPGGGVDALARPTAERLSQAWGKPVVVENKPGASTIVGTEAVVNAAPDGHTVLFTTDSSITSNPHLYKKLPFDVVKDLAPVTQLIELHQLIVIHPSVSAGSLAELVALGKQSKGLNYASYGAGSQPHLIFEMLKKTSGAAFEAVPYRGLGPALVAVLAGEAQMTSGSAGAAGGHIQAGKLKALAVTRKERLPAYPQVPTLLEAGYPGIDPRSWFGILAPARTPPAILARFQQSVAAVISDPAFKARYIEAPGLTGVASTPAEFAAFIADDLAYKRKLIETTGITAD